MAPDWTPDGHDSGGRPAAFGSRAAAVLNASVPLFRVSGIAVRLHWSFFLFILVFMGWNFHLAAGTGSAGRFVLWGLVQAAILYFGLVLLHEFGHAAATVLKGGSCSRVTLSPLGGLAHCRGMMAGPGTEAEVTIAGPLVNLVILAFSMIFVGAFGLPTGWRPFTLSALVGYAFWVNVALVVFNLVPAFPLDGGRILRSILSWRGGERWGTRVACRVGQAMAFVFVCAGVWRIAVGGFWGWLLVGIGVSNALACSTALRMLEAGVPVYEEYVPEPSRTRPTPRPGGSRREMRELRRARERAEIERRLDDLLDKVSREGMNSLTSAEKRFLRRASRHYRERPKP